MSMPKSLFVSPVILLSLFFFMKKSLLLTLLVLGLSGCSLLPSDPTSTTDSSDAGRVEKNGISIVLPTGWQEASNADIPTIKHGSVVAAYTASGSTKGFRNNLVIIQDSLNGLITSAKYSEINHLQTTRNYLEYTDVAQEIITFSDTDTAPAYTFMARYNDTTPKAQFIQTAKVCGTTVYLIHFSLQAKEKPETYRELLSTFVCMK